MRSVGSHNTSGREKEGKDGVGIGSIVSNRWEENIKMALKEIYINTRNWADSAQNGDIWIDLVNVALNLRVS